MGYIYIYRYLLIIYIYIILYLFIYGLLSVYIYSYILVASYGGEITMVSHKKNPFRHPQEPHLGVWFPTLNSRKTTTRRPCLRTVSANWIFFNPKVSIFLVNMINQHMFLIFRATLFSDKPTSVTLTFRVIIVLESLNWIHELGD
jgi:hypothetical protein